MNKYLQNAKYTVCNNIWGNIKLLYTTYIPIRKISGLVLLARYRGCNLLWHFNTFSHVDRPHHVLCVSNYLFRNNNY